MAYGVGFFFSDDLERVKLATHKDTNVEYAIKILDKKDIKENELTVSVRREVGDGLNLPNQDL